MHAVVTIETIENEILPYLSTAKRGFVTKSILAEIVHAIIYKLKTGCHWRMLPVQALFTEVVLSWNTVCYHFNKWSKNGEWKLAYSRLLSKYKDRLDMSLTHTDGSHTGCIRGGELAVYQGRKSRKTVNAIYLTDANGIPVGMSEPKQGNHNDMHEIEASMTTIFAFLALCGISTDGLFNNADGGFDGKGFRQVCEKHGVVANVPANHRGAYCEDEFLFDEEMYKTRYVIERTNAWMDSYRTILNCFDTSRQSWESWNYLAFAIILFKKVKSFNI